MGSCPDTDIDPTSPLFFLFLSNFCCSVIPLFKFLRYIFTTPPSFPVSIYSVFPKKFSECQPPIFLQLISQLSFHFYPLCFIQTLMPQSTSFHFCFHFFPTLILLFIPLLNLYPPCAQFSWLRIRFLQPLCPLEQSFLTISSPWSFILLAFPSSVIS